MLVDHDTPGVKCVRSGRYRAATSWARCSSTTCASAAIACWGTRATAGRSRCTSCNGSGACTRGSGRPRCSTVSTACSPTRRPARPGRAGRRLPRRLPMRVSSRNTIWRLVAGENAGSRGLGRQGAPRPRRGRGARPRRQRCSTRAIELGDDRTREELAPRLPLQPVGADLRRLDRDPTDDPGRPRARDAREADDGHHRSGDARPLRRARCAASSTRPDDDLTAALEDVGWRDFLAADARVGRCRSCSVCSASSCARSATLDDVAVAAMEPDSPEWLHELGQTSYVHPEPRSPVAARLDGDDLRRRRHRVA